MQTITIVTVCLNAATELVRTIESVLQQKEVQFTYIIKDGMSSDDTEDIVKQYRKLFEQSGCNLIYISKKDSGIYNAMNQALDMCTDDGYVIFMNAGDLFYDGNVLRDFVNSHYEGDVIVGFTCVKLGNKKIIATPHVEFGRLDFYHQSVFVKNRVMKKYGFDTRYRIAADRNALLNMWHDGVTFKIANLIISVFESDGYSSRNLADAVKEIKLIESEHGIKSKPYNRHKWKLREKLYRINPFLERLVSIINIIYGS